MSSTQSTQSTSPMPPTQPTSTRRHGVLAAGNFVVDQVKTIDRWPDQDGLASIQSQTRGNGGGPYNLLKDLSRAQVDYPLAAIGLVGDDEPGEYIRQDLKVHHIDDQGLVSQSAAPTSYTDVMTVASTGRRTFFHQKGANDLLAEEHFRLQDFPRRVFYFGYMCLLAKLDAFDAQGRTGASRILEQAKQQGMITIADLVSAERPDFADIVSSSLPFLDALVLNEWEASLATGIEIQTNGETSLEALEQAADNLLQRGSMENVIIHFPRGALGKTCHGKIATHGCVRLPQDTIKGAVGAGDAFAAGVVHGLHEEMDLPATLELAVCLAASSLADPTASNGVLPLADSLALGQRHGYTTL